MTRRDEFVSLALTLEREAESLGALVDAMRARRASWVELRASVLEQSVDELQALADTAATIEIERERLTGAIGSALGLGPNPTLRTINANAPADVHPRLAAAGRAVLQATRSLEVERRLGTRLLDLAREVHEGFAHDLLGLVPERPAGSYDRSAHLVTGAPQSGRLVSGTV